MNKCDQCRSGADPNFRARLLRDLIKDYAMIYPSFNWDQYISQKCPVSCINLDTLRYLFIFDNLIGLYFFKNQGKKK